MIQPQISIIIPTYNRSDILEKTVDAYSRQTLSLEKFEILIVDDGSIDNTGTFVEKLKKNHPGSLKFFSQQHKGANAARNIGIQQAMGEYLLFTGDDIIPEPDFLEEHLRGHAKYHDAENIAVLGFTTWSKEIRITPLMRYLEQSPYLPQFEYYKITQPEDLSHEFFYTSNISMHKSFLLKHGLFDEEMNKPFADDGELALRLRNKGLSINYHPSAKAGHWHEIGLPQLYKRAKTAGEMSYLFYQKHPELGPFPIKMGNSISSLITNWIKLITAKCILQISSITQLKFKGHPPIEVAYNTVLSYYYTQGVKLGHRLYGEK